MAGRTRRTMIAKAFGAEVEYVTAGSYEVAGVVQYTRDGQFHRYVAVVGNSAKSVQRRAEKRLRQVRPETLPSDYPYLIEVVTLRERTVPALRDYFGTHSVFVTARFVPGSGWQHHPEAPLQAGRSDIRRMIREGVSGFEVSKHRGSVRQAGSSPWRSADFTAGELLRSMKARKKEA